MKTNFVIDVSLLAVIFSVHFSSKNKQLELILLIALFAHLAFMNDDISRKENYCSEYSEIRELGASSKEDEPEQDEPEQNEDENIESSSTDESSDYVLNNDSETPPVPKSNPPPVHGSHTVSAGVFERQLNTPQTNLTGSVYPTTSSQANCKLANSRELFFESIVS